MAGYGNIIRTLSLLGIAALWASCRTDSSNDLNQNEPVINLAELNALGMTVCVERLTGFWSQRAALRYPFKP
jgi:hypothetical protein